MKNEIIDVAENSLAERYGIKQGECLSAINGNTNFDIIDYMYTVADEAFSVSVSDGEGNTRTIDIKNTSGEPFGVAFENYTVDRLKECCNKCIFCFVDQMPDGMRKSLYYKDDDYRLSFLCGNYITLSNLKDADIKRIIKYKLSPLNISVHVTDPKARTFVMGNRFAGDITEKLKELAAGGISFNLQFVLCPGINDRVLLRKSLEEIIKLMPAAESLSCVPVGLTKFRDGLYPLRLYTKDEACEVIDIVEEYREKIAKDYPDVSFCASDEFFVTAQKDFPAADYYGDYLQYENGVGMARSFIDGVDEFLEEKNDLSAVKAELITGTSAYSVIKNAADKINGAAGASLSVKCIKNEFFGESVSVAGLVCGCDIIKQLKGAACAETLVIPDNMLKEDEDVFLDDISVEDVEKAAGVKILIVPHDGYDFLSTLKEKFYG